MAAPQRPSQNIVAYAGLIITCAGIVYMGGQITARVDNNATRITKLEAVDAARIDQIQAIDRRTTRIEAKLDILVRDVPK